MKRQLFSLFFCFLPMAVYSDTFSITLKDNEKATIQEIVAVFGEEDERVFMQNAGNLMPKVMTLMEISSLQIIGYILSEKDLKETFLFVSKSPLKWGLFMQALHIKMEQEMMVGKIQKDLGGFAEFLSLDVGEMEHMAHAHAWGEMAMYALNRGQG